MVKINQDRFDKANQMSDHAPQVSPKAKAVSQNLQSPYAIKKNARGEWIFDLPPANMPPHHTDTELMNYIGEDLQTITALLAAMKTANETIRKANEAIRIATQAIMQTNEENIIKANEETIKTNEETIQASDNDVLQQLVALQKPGLGEPLGQGGHRHSIESDETYKRRISIQLDHLIYTLEEQAEVLCLQEQPYALQTDERRQKIFADLMLEKGYQQVATLDERDIGIWVRCNAASQYKPLRDPSLKALIERSPLRGCAIQNNTTLYINIHMDRCSDANQQINELIKLKNAAYAYALKQTPPLSVTIHGDFNLYQLDDTQKNRLSNAGYIVDAVKGQEIFAKKTYEAYIPFSKAVPYNYQHTNRWFLFKASGKELSAKSYKDYVGDQLKTAILHDLKEKIEKCNSPEQLAEFEKTLKDKPEYKILEQGQGLLTRLFKFKTSSLIALEKMLEEKKEELQNSTNHPTLN